MSQKLFILYIEYSTNFLGFFFKYCKNKAKSKKHGISSTTLKVAREKIFAQVSLIGKFLRFE